MRNLKYVFNLMNNIFMDASRMEVRFSKSFLESFAYYDNCLVIHSSISIRMDR